MYDLLDALLTGEGILFMTGYGFLCAFVGWLLRDGQAYYEQKHRKQ